MKEFYPISFSTADNIDKRHNEHHQEIQFNSLLCDLHQTFGHVTELTLLTCVTTTL